MECCALCLWHRWNMVLSTRPWGRKWSLAALVKMASSTSVPSRGPGLCAPVIRDSVSKSVRDRVWPDYRPERPRRVPRLRSTFWIMLCCKKTRDACGRDEVEFAQLICRLRPNVCQCPVCHTAMTRLYVRQADLTDRVPPTLCASWR